MWTIRDLRTRLGVPQEVIRYLVDQKIVLSREAGHGRGSPRLYSDDEALQLGIAAWLHSGLGLRRAFLRQALQHAQMTTDLLTATTWQWQSGPVVLIVDLNVLRARLHIGDQNAKSETA